MLRALRGRAHQVHTAVTLAWEGHVETRLTTSDVAFRDYSDAEMAAYIATGDPLDKAGAYAIQHPAFAPVAGWQGCYTGIMGLPLKEVAALLAQAGLLAGPAVAGLCHAHTGRPCCLSERIAAEEW
jgi:predicted house-cleaning NTP pyrophosphatase (Maf/HAM1 superfamily)